MNTTSPGTGNSGRDFQDTRLHRYYFVEQVFFGLVGKLKCVHLHLPRPVEGTLREQE
jgi:hypothetical protein